MATNGEHRDDGLDDLLRQAPWADVPAESLARLTGQWSTLTRRRRRRALAAKVAAGLMVVVAGCWQLAPRDNSENNSPSLVASPRPVPAANHAAVSSEPAPRRSAVVASWIPREANQFERLIVHSTLPEPKTSRPKQGLGTLLDEIRSLSESLEQEPSAETLARVQRLRRRYPACERRVAEWVQSVSPDQRLGATRLLAMVASRDSLALLALLAGDARTHAAAVQGLCGVATEAELSTLLSAEPDATLRTRLLTALLERKSPDAGYLYLTFVRQGGSIDEAIAALRQAPGQTVDALLAALTAPDPAVRSAAAQVLVQCDEPRVGVALLDAARYGIARREILTASLQSTSPQARQFLAAARQTVELMASVNSMEQQYRLDSPGGTY